MRCDHWGDRSRNYGTYLALLSAKYLKTIAQDVYERSAISGLALQERDGMLGSCPKNFLDGIGRIC